MTLCSILSLNSTLHISFITSDVLSDKDKDSLNEKAQYERYIVCLTIQINFFVKALNFPFVLFDFF